MGRSSPCATRYRLVPSRCTLCRITEYIEASCRVKTFGKTGIEIEALTGASIALLTVWDMVKSAEKDEDGQYPITRIEGIHVVEMIKGSVK